MADRPLTNMAKAAVFFYFLLFILPWRGFGGKNVCSNKYAEADNKPIYRIDGVIEFHGCTGAEGEDEWQVAAELQKREAECVVENHTNFGLDAALKDVIIMKRGSEEITRNHTSVSTYDWQIG